MTSSLTSYLSKSKNVVPFSLSYVGDLGSPLFADLLVFITGHLQYVYKMYVCRSCKRVKESAPRYSLCHPGLFFLFFLALEMEILLLLIYKDNSLIVLQVCLEGKISKASAMKSLSAGHSPSGDQIPWKFCEQFQDKDFPSLSGARIVRIATHPNAMKVILLDLHPLFLFSYF